MDLEDKNDVKHIQLKLENGVVKDEKKVVRKFHRQCKSEFLEENDCCEIDTKRLSNDSNEEIQYFDPAIHDAWLLQCPKGIDIKALVNKRIKMPGRRYVGDLQVRTTHYDHPLTNSVGYANNKGKYAVRWLPLTGHMMVSRRLNMEKPIADGQTYEFPKPCGPQKFRLPVRHPFFGCDYKRRIEIDVERAEQLRQADKKCAEMSATLRRTGNFYTIRRKLLASTQTLAQKEHDVRQSVLTGVAPTFMQDKEHPSYKKLMSSCDVQQPAKKSGKRNLNGELEIKLEPAEVYESVTSKPKKKRKSNGPVPLFPLKSLKMEKE